MAPRAGRVDTWKGGRDGRPGTWQRRLHMTLSQEKAITLALNVMQVGFFECPKHYYEYFVDNDEWALLMAAAGVNDVAVSPQRLALAVLHEAVAHEGFFSGMTDFVAPAHYCSFLKEKVDTGKRTIS